MRFGLLQRLLCTAISFTGMSACIVQLDQTDSDLGFDNSETGFELGTVCGSVPTCSITNDLCQNSVLRVTSCIRGNELPELPSIRVITRNALRDELRSKDAVEPTRTSIALRNALASLQLVAADSTL